MRLYAIVANDELKRLMDHRVGKRPSLLLLLILHIVHVAVAAELMILSE